MINDLLKQIEECRQEMNNSVELYGLTSSITLEISHQLDAMIIKYQKLMVKKAG